MRKCGRKLIRKSRNYKRESEGVGERSQQYHGKNTNFGK
jgi:hypothetical protein